MFVSVMLLASCASSALYVDPDSVRLRANPALVKRITASPHGYFRFINIPFSEEVCRRFSDVVSDDRYLQATREVLKQHGGLWFYDESYVISRRRD